MPRPRPPRIRRDPEDARRLILDASLRLFAERGPDAVTLKEIANEAGVSHALITHYFGTYGALVEAALEDHVRRIRADLVQRVSAMEESSPRDWVEHVWAQLADPLYGRLAAWALLTGRMNQADFFAKREQGLRKLADVIEAHASRRRGHERAREDIEFLILVVLSSLVGYGLGRTAYWAALGKEANAAHDTWFRTRLGDMVEALMGEPPAPKTATKRAARKP